jgi:hypothetical protein
MALDEDVDLSDIDDFARAIKGFGWPQSQEGEAGFTVANGLYCVRCGGHRRMGIRRIVWTGDSDNKRALFDKTSGTYSGTPGLFGVMCVQCNLGHDVLVHQGPDGPELAIFSPERGGFSTPHCPENVRYYLDQAHRAESVGATSGAVAMYRSALEMLLYEQGYTDGMLNKKIESLMSSTAAPAWRDQIDPDYLGVMKELGNAAIHPNDGDIEKQTALDRSLLLQIRMVFEELLDRVYERPAKDAERKANLTAVAASFSTP